MIEKDKITEDKKVACHVCLKEVPTTEAKSAEAMDYVAYFCGLDCYDQWLKQQDDKSD